MLAPMLLWSNEYTIPSFASNCIVESMQPSLLFNISSSGNGINLLPSLGHMLKLQSLVALSLQPRYSVSPSSSISAPYLSKYSLHPASASSGPDSRLWGSCGTVNPILAGAGNFVILDFLVFVVVMATFDGVSKCLFFCCISALSTSASSPKQVKEAAVSKNAVVFFGCGGGAQPKVLSTGTCVVLFAW